MTKIALFRTAFAVLSASLIFSPLAYAQPADGAKPDTKPDNKKAPDHTGSIGSAYEGDAESVTTGAHDTLTPDDLAVEWHGAP